MNSSKVAEPKPDFRLRDGTAVYVGPWDKSNGPRNEMGFVYKYWCSRFQDGPEGDLFNSPSLRSFAYLFRQAEVGKKRMPDVMWYLMWCRMKALCAASTVLVARVMDDGFPVAIGFVVADSASSPKMLHYIAVKTDFLRQGVARNLLRCVGLDPADTSTRVVYTSRLDDFEKYKANGHVPQHWGYWPEGIDVALSPGCPWYESNPRPWRDDAHD